VNGFEMYDACAVLMKQIPFTILHRLFIDELKKRKSNTNELKSFNEELRQLCLSMKIQPNDYSLLDEKLNRTIII
jgi:DNA-directed RNA polymerase specialized sigma24 family protein